MQVTSKYALLSLAVAIAVLALKSASFALTNSVALLSDALESIINVVVAGMALIALRVSATPADANHPFGHHKAEYLSAVLEGAFIVAAAGFIFRESYSRVLEPKMIEALFGGLLLNGFASVLNAIWGAYLLRAAKRLRSPALTADARHILADVVSSVGVAAGVIAAYLTGNALLDPIVAALAACYILYSGWQLVLESVGGLMDHAVSAETLTAIRSCIAREAGGALEAHDIQTRRAGPATFIQFHLVVPASMTVSQAHNICDHLEAKLKDEVPGAHVTIHVEPEHKAKHAGVVVL